MADLIDRQAAIDEIKNMYEAAEKWGREATDEMIKVRAESCMASLIEMKLRIEKLPSAQPEKTEYIPDTKAVRSKRNCVDLAEHVVATFYDQEYEEWTQKTVTIADVLDSVCDDYTVLPSAQPDRKKGRWISDEDGNIYCSVCGRTGVGESFCEHCGANMKGEEDDN